MICEACQNIFGKDVSSWILEDGRQIDHHAKKDNFLKAVQEHCQICLLIWRELSTWDSFDVEAPQKSSNFTRYQIFKSGVGKIYHFYVSDSPDFKHTCRGFLVPLDGLFYF